MSRDAAARAGAVRGGGLAPDGDYDGLELREAVITGQDGAGARFLDCALTGREPALTVQTQCSPG
ncbi:hypothetical protein GCM10009601_27380 [Streptomyces thermospinosisporus]|uniref:Uncharacterized protein n=1 Tax=Streptomyces thermospinosisporus TaxID=161482 RepID=A0ABN1YVL8_9ACTN